MMVKVQWLCLACCIEDGSISVDEAHPVGSH